MYVQNSGPKFYHKRHFKKEKRCSLNFCTDYRYNIVPIHVFAFAWLMSAAISVKMLHKLGLDVTRKQGL